MPGTIAEEKGAVRLEHRKCQSGLQRAGGTWVGESWECARAVAVPPAPARQSQVSLPPRQCQRHSSAAWSSRGRRCRSMPAHAMSCCLEPTAYRVRCATAYDFRAYRLENPNHLDFRACRLKDLRIERREHQPSPWSRHAAGNWSEDTPRACLFFETTDVQKMVEEMAATTENIPSA